MEASRTRRFGGDSPSRCSHAELSSGSVPFLSLSVRHYTTMNDITLRHYPMAMVVSPDFYPILHFLSLAT